MRSLPTRTATASPRVGRLPAWALLLGIVALSTVLRWWAALLVPTPWISADEQIYAELGRSLYETGRMEILGAPTAFYSLIYPALAGAPLALLSPERGYDVLKLLQACAMSLAAVPVYLWGRRFLTPRWALVAAALTLTLPGLAYAGLIMTEVAFYPVVVLAGWTLARALARPTPAAQLLALGAIVLTVLTRLQALALLPAAVTALVLYLVLEPEPGRASNRLLQARQNGLLLGGTAALALVWIAWRLARGGPASELLGAYRAAGETSYDVPEAVRFVLYHAADLVLLSGLLPACAVALLAAAAFRKVEPSADVRAYLAVTLSVCIWFVAEVGVFASRHVGHLAERDLIALAPLLFLGFALWLERGAPRPERATPIVAFAALVLVAAIPFDAFTSLATIPNTFTLIPLYRLEVRAGDVNLDLLVGLLALGALLLFVVIPRRHAWMLAALVGIGLAAISVSASRVVAARSQIQALKLIPRDERWIDRYADGPVAYLHAGDAPWSAVWMNLFWNRRIDTIYGLITARVPGPLPQASVGPRTDGTVVFADGRPIRPRYLVTSRAIQVAGQKLVDAPEAGLALWKVERPLRFTSWAYGRDPVVHAILATAQIQVFDCTRAVVGITFRAPGRRQVTVVPSGQAERRLTLEPHESRSLALGVEPGERADFCTVDLTVEGGSVTVPRLSIGRS